MALLGCFCTLAASAEASHNVGQLADWVAARVDLANFLADVLAPKCARVCCDFDPPLSDSVGFDFAVFVGKVELVWIENYSSFQLFQLLFVRKVMICG